MQGNAQARGEILSSDAESQQTLPGNSPRRGRKPKNQAGPVDFLPRVRVGRLLTVADWLREFGRVYRAVRRGQISTQDGSRLAYMATSGKEMAKAVQELRELEALRQQLQALRGESSHALPMLPSGENIVEAGS